MIIEYAALIIVLFIALCAIIYIPAKQIKINLVDFEEGDLLLISLERNTSQETIKLCANILDNTNLSNIDSIIMPQIKSATIVKQNKYQIDAIKVTNENDNY